MTHLTRVPVGVPSRLAEQARDWPRCEGVGAFFVMPPELFAEMTTSVSPKKAAEYRVMAEKCFRWARNAYMDEMRETYLQLAQFWLDVASKLDARKL